ncbi:transcriptional regulator [Streptomyces sp. HPF1205]|uniref:transcriptional regulator n=1 Tax=Streptomyces sp. HPF1205 TaxID=2873262 RepID=UPI001CEDB98B|nr:transcriptional regulator [Streptomyces sp. HPF1205]
MTVGAVVQDVQDVTSGPWPLTLTRVTLVHPESGAEVVDEHLRVGLPAPARTAALADVLLADLPHGDPRHADGQGPARAAELAAAHPGALVVAVHRGNDCWIRFTCQGLTRVPAVHRQDAGPGGQVWGVLASLVHAWLGAGLPVERLGPVLSSAAVRVHPAAGPADPSPPNPSSLARTPAAGRGRPAAEYLLMASW